MELFEQRKGITPVIAIVLLLMVTVGAVGVVYTQFNSLVQNPGDDVEDMQRNQNTEIRISQLETNVSSLPEDPGAADVTHDNGTYGTIQMTVQNTGSVARNTTAFLLSVSGVSESVPTEGDYCFTEGDAKILNPGGTYECDTGITYPQVTNEVSFEVLLTDSSKTWTESCRPETTGALSC